MGENANKEFSVDFSIMETRDLGAGDPELLKGLFQSESASGNPDDLEPIDKDTPPEKKPNVPPAKKPAIPDDTDGKDGEGKDNDDKGANLISQFLGDDDDEEGGDKGDGKDKDKGEGDEDDKGDREESVFTTLARDFLKNGIFTTDEGEEESPITTPEEFIERFNIEKKKGAMEVVNNFIGRFGEDYQNAFEAIFVKGVDPKEYFQIYNNIVSFADLDLTQESNQIIVIKQALADQGFESEDIESEVERLKNYGDLESVAAKHHKVLIKKEATKLQQKEQEAEIKQQQDAAIKNQYIKNVQGVLQEKLKTKEFDGIPINPKLAGELQEFLLVDRYKTPSGEVLTEFDRTILELKRPENHEKKVKLALLLKIMEKDPSLSTIQKSRTTKSVDGLLGETEKLLGGKSGGGSSKSGGQRSQSWTSL